MTDDAVAPGVAPLDAVTAERVRAVETFRFTERQARFLVEVMIHGGVFAPRQYNTFAGIVHGQETQDFLGKLVAGGFGRAIQVGARHRGRLYHVTFKPLYAAIGEPDNRHRKPTSLGRMVQRLMLLDAVLADRTFTWLGTERDKYTYFVRLLHGRVETREFPHLRFGREPLLTVRFFPDKLPIGVQADRTDHVFLYLITSAVPADFRVFLYYARRDPPSAPAVDDPRARPAAVRRVHSSLRARRPRGARDAVVALAITGTAVVVPRAAPATR